MFGAQNFSVGAGLRAGLGRRRGAIAARAHLGRLDVGILLGVLGGRHFSFPSSRRPSDRADHFAVLPSTDTSRAGVANWPLAWRLVRVDPGRGGSCAGAFGPERASRSELGTRVGRGRGGLARGTCAPRVGSLLGNPGSRFPRSWSKRIRLEGLKLILVTTRTSFACIHSGSPRKSRKFTAIMIFPRFPPCEFVLQECAAQRSDAFDAPRATRAMTVIGGAGFSRTKRFDPAERLALIHNAKQRTKGVSLRPRRARTGFSAQPFLGGLKRDYSRDDRRLASPSAAA